MAFDWGYWTDPNYNENHSLGFYPAHVGLEVLPWDTATGSQFLLHLLAGQISAELLGNEGKSAYSLSEKLSSHVLALSNMCGFIHRRSWSISELVEVYDRSRDFKDGLGTVWRLSLEVLQPECGIYLGYHQSLQRNRITDTMWSFHCLLANLHL